MCFTKYFTKQYDIYMMQGIFLEAKWILKDESIFCGRPQNIATSVFYVWAKGRGSSARLSQLLRVPT